MKSRFRTYRLDHNRTAPCQGSGTAGLRLCAETVQLLSCILFTALLILAVIIAPPSALASAPAGTIITNTAAAAYTDGPSSGNINKSSNTVTVTTVAFRTPSTTKFFSYAPLSPGATLVNVAQGAYRPGSDPSLPLLSQPPPIPAGTTTPIDLTKPVSLVPVALYHVGEPIFVQVTDLDQNSDLTRTETIIITLTDSVTGDTEVIRLSETGPDTGTFIGYIQSTANNTLTPYNGNLPVGVNSAIKAKYTDIVDGSDSSTDAALVDPYGIVFDSMTGKPVNGATVTLMNATTGNPATVFGDDGISAFPATVTSGATLVVNGRTYSVPPGGFRYPFVNPGQYRFRITPPAGYTAPSYVVDATLQALPGGPFALVTPGSRQEQFTINPGPAIHIDIPVDPLTAVLWLQKTAGKERVAIGDYLPYQLDLQNTHLIATAPDIVITDTLPLGLRYKQGSVKLNGAISPDPAISADGRTLSFSVGDLVAKATVSIRFVVEVAAGVRLGVITNQASARTSSSINSNLATAAVTVHSDFMQSQSIIMGEMILGPCNAPLDKTKSDLSGIRIFLEDGSYVITDKNGMYHFEGVKPGTRVVQVDLDSIPSRYEIHACEENSRFAKRSYSQFVDMQGGVLWRADFYLGLKEKLTGEVGLELLSSLTKEEPAKSSSDTVEYTVPIQIGSVPVRNLRLTIMMADGLTYLPATSSLNALPIADPSATDGVVTFRLGDFPPNWQSTVKFKAAVPRAGSNGKLVTRALLTFNTPEKDNVRTPAVDNALVRKNSEELQPGSGIDSSLKVIEKGSSSQPSKTIANLQAVKGLKSIAMPEIVLHPHFPTFSAELTSKDRKMIEKLAGQLKGLEIESITVTGHTDSVRIAPRSRHIFPDNKALSKGRAESVGIYLSEILNLPPAMFIFKGMGETAPVADNRTIEGKARNRRVEVQIRTVKSGEAAQGNAVKKSEKSPEMKVLNSPRPATPEQRVTAPQAAVNNKILNEKDRSGVKSVPTVGLRPGEQWAAAKSEITAKSNKMPEYNATWLKSAEHGSSWLWPQPGYNPPISSTNIAIKHDTLNMLKLYQNGIEVNALSFDGTLKNYDKTLAVSTWLNVDLTDGDNFFDAVQFTEDGREISRLKRVIHYSTSPVKAEFIAAKSQLIADGKTPLVIAVRLTDKDGHPVREDLIGELAIDPPYAPLKRADELKDSSANKSKFKTGDNGIALIELQPSSRTEEAVLRINLVNGSQEIRAKLTPDYRDWILVGIAEGTVGYNTLSGHMENAKSAGSDENLYDKERLAFFAKGSIKGEWLLTMAYDSAKQRTGVTGNALFQTIDPNSYYTLYGDSTSQGYEAASQKKLYLKIERDQFYAMFGDYDTGLSVTELSRYSRRMNGIKSEYRSKDYEITAFGSETAQAFVKDELRGDGTSGLYRLGKKGIVLNSEKITIESRDRFHSEVVTDTKRMSRFIDYSIDYDTGAIFFKSPIPSKDEKLNPVYIVAEYEVVNAGKDALTYGGHASTKLLNNKLQVGGTYVHEGQVTGENNLYGADATAILGSGTKARVEFATTTTDLAGTKTSGNAYLAEVTHTDKQLDGKLYYREQDSGFGVGQQKGSETATRKLGAEAGYKLSDKVTLSSQGYRQYNLATGAVRDFMEALASYNEKQYSLRSGVRYANDALADGTNATSVLGTAGGSWRTPDQKITLRADHDQALYSKSNNTDFPTRTILGVDYQATRETMLFAQEELTFADTANTNTTRVGVKSTPWSGGTINSSVVNDMKENSERTFANVGLTQRWQINPLWAVDGGLDHNQTIRKKTGYSLNTNVPPASGGDDFTAVSLGANYTEKKFSWSNRVEYRNSNTEDKWGFISGLINEQGLNWGWTTRVQLLHTQSFGNNTKTSGDLRFGLAYRPPVTKWIVLDRLDLLMSDEKSSTSSTQGKRIINNLNANYKPDKRTQVSIQYGAKYVMEKIDEKDYSGYTDLIGIEGRYDLTKEWDLGLRTSLLHTWASDQFSYSFGPSIGYNVMENAWISLGYNFAGFTDKDFSAANYSAQGPFIQFRFKFDQNSIKEGLKMINQ